MKKIVKWIGCMLVILIGMIGLASCDEKPQSEKHQHVFADRLEYDRKGHYYPATCEHTDIKKDYEEHRYQAWKMIKEATEQEEGLQERVCNACGYIETESIPCIKHTHVYGKWELKKEPSLTEEGSLEKVCKTDASHTEVFQLPKLNETAYQYQVTKKPTCEEDGTGIATYTYQKDEQSFSFPVTLKKLDHSYGEWKVEVEPTLSSKGSLVRVCTKNATHIDRLELPILNEQDYGYTVIKEKNCYEDGLDRYTFHKGDKDFSFDVKRLSTGHTYQDDYSFDSTKHWLDPSCEHMEVFKDTQSHTFEHGICTVCSYVQDAVVQEGVIYTLNEDQTAYSASLDCTYQKDSIVILDQYQDLPVTDISTEGFMDSSAKFITIPNSIRKINSDAFKNCSNLMTVFYGGTIEDWCKIQFMNEYATPMYYANSFYMLKKQAWEEMTTISVPETITILNDYQFYGFTHLSHIDLPDTMIRVCQYAFAKCSSIEELIVSSSFIDEHILMDCDKLTRLTLGYLDSTISLGFFFGGSNSSIPESLTEVTILGGTQIQNYAFRGIKNLTKLILPNTLVKVGNGIVDGCDKLLYNEKDNGLYLGNEENPYLILMRMKDKEVEVFNIDPQTKFIADSAFYQASYLKEIVIPTSVIEIGSSAFRYATSLKTIMIPERVQELYEYTFADCTALEEVIIPETVLKVDSTCFKSTPLIRATLPYHALTALTDTSLLEELYLLNGEGAVHLGSYPKLKKVNLPLGITSIGDNVVESCPDLIYNEDDYCKYLGNEEAPYTWLMQVKDKTISECVIQDNTFYIYPQAFMDCGQLESIHIPYSLRSIGMEAFKNNTKLWNVSFPSAASKLDIIEASVFEGCTALEVIALPNSLSMIGKDIFKNCSSLRKLTLPFVGKTKNSTKASSDTLFGYLFGNGTGTAISQSYVTDPKSYQNLDYSIPDTLKEVIVQGGTLWSGAFMNCSMITNLTLSDQVDFVTGYLYTSPAKVISQFYHCQFEKVTMPSKFIPLMNEESRSGLSKTIQSLTITSGETIPAYACERMTSLTELILADSIKTIQHGAFSDCNLKSVKLPNQLEVIEAMAFYLNSSLKSIILPRTVQSIGNSAFEECSSLESIYLPQTIKTIGSRVFYNVTATFYLEGTTIPEGWDLSATRPIYYTIKDMVVIEGIIYAIRETDALFVGYAGDGTTGEIPSTIVYQEETYTVTIPSTSV